MKHVVVLLSLLLVVSAGISLAEDGVEPVEEPVDGKVVVLNATQQDKVTRLSEASGVAEEEILLLRAKRTRVEVDPDTEPVEGEEADAPKGRGWGVIAKWLGLHPGTVGKGTGEKFYPVDEEQELEEQEAGEEPNVLTMRERKREARLTRTQGDEQDGDSLDVLTKERKRELKHERILERKAARANVKEKNNKGRGRNK